MRDYYVRNRKTGERISIADLPTPRIERLLGKARLNIASPTLTEDNFRERLRIELLIRSMKLR